MKKLLFPVYLFLLIGIHQFALAQIAPFSKVINFLELDGIQSYASCQNDEGNTLIVGESYQDYGMVILIDKNGDQIWNKGFSVAQSNRHPVFNDAIFTHDSCYFLLGNYYHPEGNQFCAFYTKINNAGDSLWSGSLNLGSLYRCAESSDGGFILIGYKNNVEGSEHSQIALAKIDSYGSLEWSKVLKIGAFMSSGHAIRQMPNGHYLLCGYYQPEAYVSDIAILAEISDNGEPIWIHTYEDQLDDRDLEADDFIIHNDSIYVLLNNEWNSMILKTDILGNTIWSKEIHNTTYWNYLNMGKRKLKLTANKDLLFVSSETFSAYTKLDLEGNVLLTGSLFIVANDIHSTENDGILVLGNGPIMLVKNEWNNNIGLIQMDETGDGINCTEIDQNYSEDKQITSSELSFTLLNGGSETSVIMDITPSIPLDIQDGCVDAIGGTKDTETCGQYTIYPNPNKGSFTLESKGIIKGKLSILNHLGQVILEDNISTQLLRIDLSKQTNGIYFYKIENKNHTISSGRFVLQK